MSNRLKNYIITVLLNKDSDNIDHEKYADVIKALATNNHVDDICSYIMRSVQMEVELNKVILTDNNILDILSTAYCVDRAYEYLMYLQNNHELVHDCEFEVSQMAR